MIQPYVAVVAMWLFGSLRQEIPTDPSKWVTFAYPRQDFELTLRVPDHYISIEMRGSPTQPLELNSSIHFFDFLYDYGQPVPRDDPYARDSAQLSMGVSLVRMADRPAKLVADDSLLQAMDKALKSTAKRQPETTELVTIHGRKWLRRTGITNVGTMYDSFDTFVGTDQVLLVGAGYGRKMMRNEKWLQSRRELLRQVVEQVTLIEHP